MGPKSPWEGTLDFLIDLIIDDSLTDKDLRSYILPIAPGETMCKEPIGIFNKLGGQRSAWDVIVVDLKNKRYIEGEFNDWETLEITQEGALVNNVIHGNARWHEWPAK